MINSFKKKENRIKEMVKRFHFDPQTQSSMNKSQVGSVVGKQKISQIITKDQNGQYSSVKQKNQFNDSSWLAKLVNGIQQCQGPSVKYTSDVQNLNSLGSENINCKLATEGQFYTITRKSSDNSQTHNLNLQKLGGRKSVPSITNFRNQRSRQNKFSCHTIALQNQNKKQSKQQTTYNNKPKYQKSTQNTQNIAVNYQNKKTQKIVRNIDRNNKKRNRVLTKEQQCQNIKNSLINYSSIKQQDRNSSPNQQSPQKIIIDLDQISLNTEISKQTTPIHTKYLKNMKQHQKQPQQTNKQEKKHPSHTPQQKKPKQIKQENNKISIQFSKNKSKQKRPKTGKKVNQNSKEKENIKASDCNNFIKIQQQEPKAKIQRRVSPAILHHQNLNNINDCNNNNKQISQNNIKEADPTTWNNSPQIQKLDIELKISRKQSLSNNIIQEKQLPLQEISNKNINNNTNKQLQIQNLDKDKYFSSYNQFLDTFKQQPILQCVILETEQPQPTRVGGIIKKNKKNSEVSRIQVKQLGFYSEEARIPTFSERPQISQQIGVSLPMISKQITLKQASTKKASTFSPIKFGYQIKKQNIQKQDKDKSVSTIKKGESNYSYHFNQRNNQNNHNLTSSYHLQFPTEGLSQSQLQQSQSYSDIKLQKYKNRYQQTIQSPKFNYKPHQSKKQNERPGNKILNYDQIFKKLDINKERKLHKSNCNESKLTEEQRYQIGPILSKIKYLDRLFTENQFALQCMKIKNSQIKCQKSKIPEKSNLSNYHTFHPHKKQQKPDNSNKMNSSILNPSVNFNINTRSADRRKQYMKQNQNVIRGNIINSKNSEKVKRYRKFSDKRQQQRTVPHQVNQFLKNSTTYQPLFPQTQEQSQFPHPSRSPYLQMPSFPSEHQQKIQIAQPITSREEIAQEKRQKGDIGTIIDNLNTKLSNYIQNNNLEDTYRKFKLQFVQLRRNMPY